MAFKDEVGLKECEKSVHDNNEDVERSIALQCYISSLKDLRDLKAIMHHTTNTKGWNNKNKTRYKTELEHL